MKKIILILFIIINSLLFISPAFAMTPTPLPTIPFAIPGLNCGYAGIVGKDSCCKVENPEVNTIDQNEWGIPDVLWTVWNILPIVKVANMINKFVIEKKAMVGVVGITCQSGVPDSDPSTDPNCKCINAVTPSPGWIGALNSFCQSQYNLNDRNACLQCANGGGVYSGIGCVKTDFKSFIEETVFGIGIGLAGGFSLLCIIYAAFMMQSSEGNPEKLKKAQEMITSCIIGLMLIIFSVFILKLIGVNILRIPGFG